MAEKIRQLALFATFLIGSLVMANGLDENRRFGVTRVGTQGNPERMADRRYAMQIRDIASDRGLTGTRRRAAVALAALERNAPRSMTAVARPVTTESMRLLQEAVNNPRLRGSGRRALITGAAELEGRSDIAEDLTFGRGLRSVRVRPSRTRGLVSGDGNFNDVQAAGSALRDIQRRGLRQPRIQRPTSDQYNLTWEEGETFEDDLDDLLNYGSEF